MAEIIANAFTTIEQGGLLSQIITNCGICKSYDPILNKGHHPTVGTYSALWDTGATGTVINKKVVDELGLLPTGMVESYHANGMTLVNTYLVNVFLPNNMGMHSVTVTEGVLSGFDVLIGMNVITQGDFCISNFEGKTVCTFQMPSTKKTDYVEENEKKKHTPIIAAKEPGRNDKCHCGSGKKYKNCCIK